MPYTNPNHNVDVERLGHYHDNTLLILNALQPKYTVTSSTSGTVNLAQDNTVVIDGTPSAVAVTLPAPTSGKDYECGLIFTAGTGIAVSETAPSGYTIEYADADTPTFTAGKCYEILYRCLFNGKISAKYAVI